MNYFKKMPKYKCHKVVAAVKIKYLKIDEYAKNDGAMVVPTDGSLEDFPVSQEFINKHKPKAGGYYVVYEDGYQSYSPADAFESGYTKL